MSLLPSTATAAAGGVWRDRTNLYISYRQSYAHHPAKRGRYAGAPNDAGPAGPDGDSEQARLMGYSDNAGDAVIEMDVLPPRWLDIQDEVTELLDSISPQMKKLDQLHAKHILPGFDDESVKAREERDIEALTHDITRGFTSCQKAIKRIDVLVREGAGRQFSSAEEKMAHNLKTSLASRVGDVSSLFRKKQSAYLKKLQHLGGLGAGPAIGDRTNTPLAKSMYTDPAMMDSESDRTSAQSTLLQTAQVRRQTGEMDASIEQREREIEKIAQGVIDLSNLFQDLQTMVIDQGTVLDRIDYNVELTVEQVREADKELKVATGYQKRSTRRKIMLLLLLIVAGLFILLLIKPKRSRQVAAEPAPEGNTAHLRDLDFVGHMPLERLVRRHMEWKQRKRR